MARLVIGDDELREARSAAEVRRLVLGKLVAAGFDLARPFTESTDIARAAVIYSQEERGSDEEPDVAEAAKR